jgi:hypothetical protein
MIDSMHKYLVVDSMHKYFVPTCFFPGGFEGSPSFVLFALSLLCQDARAGLT